VEGVGSAALEAGLSLLQEGGDGLDRVLGAEVHRLAAALVVQGLLEALLEGPVEHPLRHGQRDRRPRGEAGGPVVHEGVDLTGGEHAVDDAEVEGVLGGDDVGEEGQLLGPVQAHQAGQEPGGPAVEGQAPAGEDHGEARLLGRDHEVAAEGEAHPDARRHPGHLGDRRLRQLVEGLHHGVDAAHGGQLVDRRAAHAPEVGPGAERPAGAGEHDAAVVGGGEDRRRHLQQLVPHPIVDRVAPLWAVERDRHDPVRPFDLQGVHRRHDTDAMGLNPFRQQRRSPADYLMVAGAVLACVLLVLWALFG
jgi:hypothetical protein